MEDLQKKWLKTGIENDFVFYYVMKDNPDICLELLQMIFPDLGIKRVKLIETQKVVEEAHDVRGVRLDVYAEDSDNHAYDIEMQATNKGNLRKRSRFNQSMMDMHQLARSMDDYDKLKKSFVIFLCDFDLFGEERYVYTFENVCMENKELKLEDGITKVFINAKGKIGTVSDKLKRFLKMVSEHKATDDFTRKIQEAIDYEHMDEEARIAYMTVGMKIAEERKEAWNEGVSQGIVQGTIITLKSLVEQGTIGIDMAAKQAGMTVEEFEKAMSEAK